MIALFLLGLLGTATAQWQATCGTSTDSNPCSGTRIVGGAEASEGEFPHQVGMIQNIQGDSGQVFCGGTVLNANYVITAAHCTAGSSPGQIDVVIGRTNRNSHPNQIRRDVAEITDHNQYNPNTFENDISLLRTSTAMSFNSYRRPACQPSTSDDSNGNAVCVSGWGTTSSGGSQPDIMRYVMVHVVSNANCQSDYTQENIVSSMLCASDNNQDSCQGDSGGPLVHYRSGARLVGVVSWGYGCADARWPGVYTRVVSFLGWISSNAN